MSEPLRAPTISVTSRAIVYACLFALAAGSIGVLSWKLLWPALTTGTPPPSWSWPTLLALELGLCVVVGWISFSVYKKFTTELSTTGVSTPTWRGRVLLPWSRVEAISVRGHEIVLRGAGVQAVVNIFCFSDPKAVSAFIAAHAPAHIQAAA